MMKLLRTTVILLEAMAAVGCMQPHAPNDTVSRALNEMKAVPHAATAKADPRDARLADLERQAADRDAELARLRGMSGNFDQANRRTSDLERQLADRDRELAALRGNAGDSSKLAAQLSSATSELDQAKNRAGDLERQLAQKDQELAGLRGGRDDQDKLTGQLGAMSGDLDQCKRRIADLERQLAQRDQELAALRGAAGDKDKTMGRIGELERHLAERDQELARLRGDLSAEMQKLTQAQRGLVKALRPEIEKGNITVDLNNERLLINLASAYLFGSGEDQLKPAGADALKRVGQILKDYPEYKTQVDGHTDNRPIRSSLKKRFPSNKELSDARAANAVKALAGGGVSFETISSTGYADAKPVAPNTTEAGRQKNRRVEVRVTPKS
ncbi:MAG: OmpA family protein [Nitrospiraceae bacterium]